MRIAMIGSGYVGLVSGACFAQFGHDVVCIDKEEGKIERLRRGEMPIYEPGLDAVVRRTRGRNLRFITQREGATAVAEADAFVQCRAKLDGLKEVKPRQPRARKRSE